MSEGWNDEDDLSPLLHEALHEIDHVPEEILTAAYGALSWQTIDAELAQLTYDSDRAGTVGQARSQKAALRALTFASNSFVIELHIEPKVLLGQLIPVYAESTLVVTTRNGSTRTTGVDELGCFTIDPIPLDTFRLHMVGEQSVMTDWISL